MFFLQKKDIIDIILLRVIMIKIIKRINNSAMWAIEGIKATFKEEFMARVQFTFCIIQLGLALVLGYSFFMLVVMACMSLLLISAELMNTAVENVCDMVTEEKHQYIKRAKDSAGAAVFIISVFNWVMFFVFAIVTLYA